MAQTIESTEKIQINDTNLKDCYVIFRIMLLTPGTIWFKKVNSLADAHYIRNLKCAQ